MQNFQLLNLLSNAIQASSAGASISIRSRRIDDTVEVTVQDQGKGLTEEECRHIFDPFYTSREGDGGTGLGLSIVHGIISEHSGTIDVQSIPQQGTTMTITLPWE